jgi:type II secretion system protein G
MSRRAFTLVELLVVISIIGLLSSIAVVSLNASRIKARNIKRKTDMVQITKALELYYTDNNIYPSTSDAYWGTCAGGGNKAADAWIPGLVSGGYMSKLPSDPTSGTMSSYAPLPCNNGWACYAYISDGTSYKIMALCTPEGANAFSASEPFIDPARTNRSWAIYTPTTKGASY